MDIADRKAEDLTHPTEPARRGRPVLGTSASLMGTGVQAARR